MINKQYTLIGFSRSYYNLTKEEKEIKLFPFNKRNMFLIWNSGKRKIKKANNKVKKLFR